MKNWKFRKPRSIRACEVCRLRKVRCNSETQIPCSNCVTFGCECKFPELKKRRRYSGPYKDPNDSLTNQMNEKLDEERRLEKIGKGSSSDQLSNLPLTEFPSPQNSLKSIHVPQVTPSIQVSQVHSIPQVHSVAQVSSVPSVSQVSPPLPHHHHVQPPLHRISPSNALVSSPGLVPIQRPPIPPNHSQSSSALPSHLPPSQPQSMSFPSLLPQYNVPPVVQFPGYQNYSPHPPTIHPNYQSTITPVTASVKNEPTSRIPSSTENNIDGWNLLNDNFNPNDSIKPNDPVANISMINILPSFDTSDYTKPSSGLKIGTKTKYSPLIYYGSPSYCHYLAGTNHDDPFNATLSDNNLTSDVIQEELQILNIKGCFKLPSKYICNILIEAFFDDVYPYIPLIDKEGFISHFNHTDPNLRPPLILIQAVLLIGSKVCNHPAITDASGSSSLVHNTLYKRVKALVDANIVFDYIGNHDYGRGNIANYQPNLPFDDGYILFNYPTVLVQVHALLSMYSRYWDNHHDYSQGPFYWLRCGTLLATTFGFHTNMKSSNIMASWNTQFSNYSSNDSIHHHQYNSSVNRQLFMWKKIFWFLFSRDRLSAFASGQPLLLHLNHCNVEPLTLNDYELYETTWNKNNQNDVLVANFFVQQIRLTEIIGGIIDDQYLMINETFKSDKFYQRLYVSIKQYNYLMAYYMRNLPSCLRYNGEDTKSNNIYALVIAADYYATLYHINRLRSTDNANGKFWGISYQSIYMISHIGEALTTLKSAHTSMLIPDSLVYNISLALMVLAFHTEASVPVIQRTSQKQLDTCLQTLQLMNFDGNDVVPLVKYGLPANQGDVKHGIMARYKRLIMQENATYQDVWKKCHHYIRPLGINALLSTDRLAHEEDFKITGKEYNDTDLPISKVCTMMMPKFNDADVANFDAHQLFCPTSSKLHQISSQHSHTNNNGVSKANETEINSPGETVGDRTDITPSEIINKVFFLYLAAGLDDT